METLKLFTFHEKGAFVFGAFIKRCRACYAYGYAPFMAGELRTTYLWFCVGRLSGSDSVKPPAHSEQDLLFDYRITMLLYLRAND